LQPPGGNSATGGFAADQTRRIVLETFESWERIMGRKAPPLPDFSENDWRLVQIQTGNRPLYLQMAALHACEQSTARNLPTWGRSELLKAAVTRERMYVGQECKDPDLKKAVEHVTAILCLTGVGLSRGRKWNIIVDEELKSIGVSSVTPNQVEHNRRAIFTESRLGIDGEVGVIQPDIVSEGYAATVLQEEEEPPTDTLHHIVQMAGMKAWANLLRMVQDLVGIMSFEHIEDWLTPLVPLRPTEELQQLVHVVPERADSLHGFGLLVGEELLKRIPETSTLERATCLLVLGTHRHRCTNSTKESHEQALKELHEAISLYNKSVASGVSSNVTLGLTKAHRILGAVLSDLGRYEEAITDCWIAAKLIGGFKDAFESPLFDYANISVAELVVPEAPEEMRELGNSLNSLSIQLRVLKANEKAVEVSKLAVVVGERLIGHSWRLYAPDMGRYLNNLSQGLMELGNYAEALVHCRRSVQIREEFARQNPDEYARPLCLSLGNLVSLEYAEHNTEAALSTTEKIIQIYSELSSRNPAYYRDCLAQSYHNIGFLFYKMGDRQQSLNFTQKGLEIRKELAASNFDTYALDLAWSHHNISCDYENMGDPVKARVHAEIAYDLRKKWADLHPGQRIGEIFQNAEMIARNFRNAGDKKGEKLWLERVAEAIDRYLPELGPDQGNNYHSAAQALGRLGDVVRAADCARKSADCFRHVLTDSNLSSNPKELADLRCSLSSALAMQGDWENNEAVLAEGIEVAKLALEPLDPSKGEVLFVWGALKHNLGHCLFRKGEMIGSLEMVRDGLNALVEAANYQRVCKFDVAAAETEELIERVRSVIVELEKRQSH
jgi:tetratricopeptide (TPR) repeat protein